MLGFGVGQQNRAMPQDAGDGDPAQPPPPPPPSQQQQQQPGDNTAVVSGSSAVNGELDGALPPALTEVNIEHSPLSGSGGGGGGGDGDGSRGGGDSPVDASAGSSPADSTESMGDDSTTVRQYSSSSRGTSGGRRGGGGGGGGGGGPLEEEEEEDDEDRQLNDSAPVDDGRCVCVCLPGSLLRLIPIVSGGDYFSFRGRGEGGKEQRCAAILAAILHIVLQQ